MYIYIYVYIYIYSLATEIWYLMMSWPNEPMIHVALRNQLPIILFYQKCKQHMEITVVGCRTGSDPNQRYPHDPTPDESIVGALAW